MRQAVLLGCIIALSGAGAAQAALPGNNGRLVFTSNNGLELIQPDGTGRTPIPGTAGARRPAWSPSADLIAFNRTGGGISVVAPDGSGQRALTTDGGTPSWSPDGTRLAFQSDVDGNSEIYTIRLDGSDRQRLTNDAAADAAAAWSPDGNRIAFLSNRSGDFQVWTLPVAGGSPSQFSKVGDAEGRPSWHPSGGRIAFTVDPGDFVDIFVADGAEGSTDQRITFAGNDFASAPAFSPDGQRIAYQSKGALWTAGASGSGPAPVPNADGGNEPDWERRPTPIVFVHGFLGSVISCGTDELWPDIGLGGRPDLLDMQLDGSGAANLQQGSCNPVAAPSGGLVLKVPPIPGGSDIYGGTVDFLRQIAPTNSYFYAWDWRMSPERALDGLNHLIEAARCGGQLAANVPTCPQPIVEKVVLMGHSMGGLVIRWYIDDPDRAKKVSRALTVGTPYWGSPKAIFPLAAGVEMPGSEAPGLDTFLPDDDLKQFARNLQGAYFLFPSANYGDWLTVGLNSGQPLDRAGLTSYVAGDLGGNAALLDNAYTGHAQFLDGFKTNGVDYQALVGTGLNTVGQVKFGTAYGQEFARLGYGNGDGTVPAVSGAQGQPGTVDPLGEDIKLHYACGVGHVPLPGDPGVTKRIKDFLLTGGPIDPPVEVCPNQGAQIAFFDVDLGPAGAPRIQVRAAQAGSSPMTLAEAEAAGLVDVIDLGTQTIVVTNKVNPVSFKYSATRYGVSVIALDGESQAPEQLYGPLAGQVELNAGDEVVVTQNGNRLSPHPDSKAPTTDVTLAQSGKRFVLRRRARDDSGVLSSFLAIGAGEFDRWVSARKLKRGELRGVRYGSLDVFGNAEPERRLWAPLSLRLRSRSRAVARLLCPKAEQRGCRGRVRLLMGKRPVGGRKIKLRRGRTKAVPISLTSKGRRRIARRRRASLKLVVTAGGARTQRTFSVAVPKR